MDTPTDERDPLEVLAEEFTQRLRRGETPDLAEYTARHPDLADDIRELFPTLRTLEAGPVRRRPGEVVRPVQPPPERLGDFHLLWEVGRGGMGLVYEAVQESLGRRVALKILPPELVRDPVQAERFQREAQTAARLHHTHIVPVFGIGEHRGVHYYAMQFIDGVSLDKALRQRREHLEASALQTTSKVTPKVADGDGSASDALRPVETDKMGAELEHRLRGSVGDGFDWLTAPQGHDYFRLIADLGRQAAEGLHYAHSQGVIHRDIKPANLMLDRQANLWIADFGLAKSISGEDLTSTGQVVGTLRYLAPERLSGETTALSDQYSLGATLYEALALRPLFPDKRHEQLIDKVTRVEPTRLRSLDPRIPVDLETIIHKTLAKEPGRRYAHAGELATDLRRFLEHRPIQARRISTWQRATLWARRNPALASTTSALLVALVAGLVVALYFWHQAEGHREDAEQRLSQLRSEQELTLQARRQADLQRERAEANLAATRRAVNEWFIVFSENQLLNVPGVQGLRRELLLKARAFYDEILQDNANNPKLRKDLANAHFRLGKIHMELGDREKAREHFRAAMAGYESLVKEEPTPAHRLGFALSMNGCAMQEAALARADQARELYGRGRAVLVELLKEQPENLQAALALALLLGNLSLVDDRLGQMQTSLQAVDEGIAVLHSLPASLANEPRVLDQIASLRLNKGATLVRHGRSKEAAECLRLVWDYRKRLWTQRPSEVLLLRQLQTTGNNLAQALLAQRQLDEAEAIINETLVRGQRLLDLYPDLVEGRRDLAVAFQTKVLLHERRQQWPEAEAAARQALLHHRQLQSPTASVAARNSLGLALQNLSVCLLETQKYDECLEAADEAIRVFDALQVVQPKNASCFSNCSSAWSNRAAALRRLQRYDEMIESYQKSLAASQRSVELEPASRSFRMVHVAHFAQLASALALVGRFAEAAKVLEDGEDYASRLRDAALRLARAAGSCLSEMHKKSPGERDLPLETMEELALRLLKRAVSLGYRDGAALEKDASFSALRKHPAFQAILAELGQGPPR